MPAFFLSQNGVSRTYSPSRAKGWALLQGKGRGSKNLTIVVDASHEHLYEFGLINMNNRLYDPTVGRILAIDNFVADSESTQAFNRYSYAMNNPLKYVDPSGDAIHIAVFIGAAVIGGGFNLWSNWGNINGIADGLSYFVSGAVGGAASVVSPLAGGLIAISGNLATDALNGTLSNLNTPVDVATHLGFTALEGVGAGGAGTLAKGAYNLITSVSWSHYGQVTTLSQAFIKKWGLSMSQAATPTAVKTVTTKKVVSAVAANVFKSAKNTFEIAKAGGKHSGFLKNYVGRSPAEINKAIKSMQSGKQGINVHLDKIANPTKYVPNWNILRPGHQQSLINGWKNTVTKHTEQIQILRTLLGN